MNDFENKTLFCDSVCLNMNCQKRITEEIATIILEEWNKPAKTYTSKHLAPSCPDYVGKLND